MVSKVRQIMAGLTALRADKNMKKANATLAEANYYYNKRGKTPPNHSYAEYVDKAKTGRRKSDRQKNRANRQYEKADRLMGY